MKKKMARYLVYNDLIDNISDLLNLTKAYGDEGLRIEDLEDNLKKSLNLPPAIKNQVIEVARVLFTRGDFDIDWLISCCEFYREFLDDDMSKNYPLKYKTPPREDSPTDSGVFSVLNSTITNTVQTLQLTERCRNLLSSCNNKEEAEKLSGELLEYDKLVLSWYDNVESLETLK
jgi:hypothetical protein